MLISLSGDIHLNPGLVSPGIFLCGLCDETVSDVDKATCYDNGEKWILVHCDHYIMTEDNDDYLIQNPSSDPCGSVQLVLKFVL